jgi:uncharacterized membrane protein YkvA (DUF1232 family)
MDYRPLNKRILALPWRAKFRLGRLLLADDRVPLRAKLVLPGVVAYLLMPLDIIPDFIPVLGQIDDLLLIAGGLWLFLRLSPADVVEEHVRALAANADE